uniref:Uncharacterized protein n=1 Tax=Arundo donax TaxID=35708 RepID=A0A0A9F7X7_ARUDO
MADLVRTPIPPFFYSVHRLISQLLIKSSLE